MLSLPSRFGELSTQRGNGMLHRKASISIILSQYRDLLIPMKFLQDQHYGTMMFEIRILLLPMLVGTWDLEEELNYGRIAGLDMDCFTIIQLSLSTWWVIKIDMEFGLLNILWIISGLVCLKSIQSCKIFKRYWIPICWIWQRKIN